VEGSRGNRCVVDLKTRLTQAEPTASQRRQLLVYCFLVGATSGDIPTRIAIEDPSGRRWEERIDEEEIAGIITEIQAALAEYKRAVIGPNPSEMANPGPDTCRLCPYRVACGPYWEALQASWEHGSVAGNVTNIKLLGRDGLIELDALFPREEAGSVWVVTAVPKDALTRCSFLAIVDGEITGAAKHLRWRWSTMTSAMFPREELSA
jgi:hypothetical protein